MDRESGIKIPRASFPGHRCEYDKDSLEYGLEVGRAISSEWFGGKGNSLFQDQWVRMNEQRLYAAGEQNAEKYLKQVSPYGDISHLNLDTRIIKVIPKFVDIVVNGMRDREMFPVAYSQDASSAEKRSQLQDMIESDMIAKDFLTSTKDLFGIDAFNFNPDELPDDEEEMSLWMQMKHKPAIEIAQEVAISTVLDDNYYDDLSMRLALDQVTLGKCIEKHSFNEQEGIKIEYVDPAMCIHSFTEDPYYKDVFYWGEVKAVHYTEIYKLNPQVTKEELETYKNFGAALRGHFPQLDGSNIFQDEYVLLLYFNYKTDRSIKFKSKVLKNGGRRLKKKDEKFNAESNELFEAISVSNPVWYSGIMVVGTDKLLSWKLNEWMVKPGSATQKLMSDYVACSPRMYKGVPFSLVDRMMPFSDQIQLTNLKLQQIKSGMVPDGVFIDADGINGVDLGTGGTYNPEDALRLYFETGSVLGRSNTADGDFNNARVPIQPLESASIYNKMRSLIDDYHHQLQQIRDVTGLNEARDASTPDPKALVGLQKMAAMNSNVATRHILDALVFCKRTICEAVSMRLSDIMKYSPIAREFAMKIGKFNMQIISDIQSFHLHSFGINIELSPDTEEREKLEANISVALQQQTIELEDAIEIRSIRNVKQANEMLKIKKKRRQKQREEREDIKMQMQGQINMQTQQMANEAAMAKIQAETQAKLAVKNAETQGQLAVIQAEVEAKEYLMSVEFNYNMQLKGIEAQTTLEKQQKAEEEKNKRISKQATAQSKLIDQRRNNLPPIDFESTNDNLGDFDLESFEPK